MATESFLKEINIKDKKSAENFVDALERAENKKSKIVKFDKEVEEIKNLQDKINETIDKITVEDIDLAIKKADKEIEEENKPFEEIFNKIKKKARDFATIDNFVVEYYNKEGYEFVRDIKFVEPLKGGEEHRWYVVGNSIYSININGEDYYFGATEVTTLKSESMDIDDTYWETKVFKVKKVIKEVFEIDE